MVAREQRHGGQDGADVQQHTGQGEGPRFAQPGHDLQGGGDRHERREDQARHRRRLQSVRGDRSSVERGSGERGSETEADTARPSPSADQLTHRSRRTIRTEHAGGSPFVALVWTCGGGVSHSRGRGNNRRFGGHAGVARMGDGIAPFVEPPSPGCDNARMDGPALAKVLRDGPLLSDGGMGTSLVDRGVPVGACVTGGANTFASEARIARQSSGKGLYVAFD